MKMSSMEFSQWQAFEEIEPGSPARDDFHFATLCWLIWNMLNGKGGRKMTIQDFLPMFGTEKRADRPTQKELKSKLLSWKSLYEAEQKGRSKHV